MQIQIRRLNVASLVPVACLVLVACLANHACTAPAVAQTSPAPPLQANTAVVEIKTPREGNLLHLRGLAGRGTATVRMNGACSVMPVRFVAGDFSGQRIDVGRAEPIRMVIRAPHLVERLMQGHDLISDTLRVSDDPNAPAAEILLVRGLSAETGFVINPGRNVVADLWGPRTRPIPCDNPMGMEQGGEPT